METVTMKKRSLPKSGNGLLDDLGVTKEQFTKFVKLNQVARNTGPIYTAIQKILKSNNNYDWTSSSERAWSCCGVLEIGNCTSRPKGLYKEVLRGLLDGYRYMIYYSVDASTRAECERLGFQETASFTNQNTSRTVRVMQLNLWDM